MEKQLELGQLDLKLVHNCFFLYLFSSDKGHLTLLLIQYKRLKWGRGDSTLDRDTLYSDFNEVIWKFSGDNTVTCRARSALIALPAWSNLQVLLLCSFWNIPPGYLTFSSWNSVSITKSSDFVIGSNQNKIINYLILIFVFLNSTFMLWSGDIT